MYCRCSSLGAYSLCAGLASGQLVIYDEYLIPVSSFECTQSLPPLFLHLPPSLSLSLPLFLHLPPSLPLSLISTTTTHTNTPHVLTISLLYMYIHCLQCADANPSNVLELGPGPIRSVQLLHNHLYASCGQEIVVINTSHYTIETKWKAITESVTIEYFSVTNYLPYPISTN